MKFLWNVKSGFYHTLRNIPGLRTLFNQEKENLRALLPLSIRDLKFILDTGTGSGSSLDIFPSDIPIVAVDQSLAMLKQAKKQRDNIIPVVADIRAMPFRNLSIPFCSCIGVTEYIPVVHPFLLEIHRVMADFGWILITASRHAPLNYLRYLLGHRLYLRSVHQWVNLFKQTHFTLQNRKFSLIQTQWLLKKE